MTLGTLRELLSNLPDDMEVILQKDAEGNGYSPLKGVDVAVYVPNSTWSGDVYSLLWSASECCMSEEEWMTVKNKPRCVVFAPIN